MSKLRKPVKFLDGLMDKVTKKHYLVLYEDLHFVWVFEEGGGSPPKKLAKNIINLAYTKVDPKIVKVLYAKSDNILSEPSSNNE